MADWWNNSIIWLSSPGQAALVNMAIWASLIVSVLWMMFSTLQRVRFDRKMVRRTQASAKAQARLAVFNSWIKAGGWTTDLSDSIYDSLLRQYDEMAMKHGDEYFSDYCEEKELAQAQLDVTLENSIKAWQEITNK